MRILAGLETEYGLYVEGRGAENQVEDSMTLVRKDPSQGRFFWDYRYESPRRDLRGFEAERLSVDPEDLRFDQVKPPALSDRELRADRILPNGARFYNDHGHPEYATPECWSLDSLVAHDVAGERHVHRAAQALSEYLGRPVRVYKNNTDFHGASYGTHESYLVPRSLPVGSLQKVLLPMLVARTLLCGAGKVGSERKGDSCRFQLSARADFLTETASVDTLYRRPIFNTRDEPHANARDWMRLHVICGDANLNPHATRRKVGLVKLALSLALAGWKPDFELEDPVDAFLGVSRDWENPCITLVGGMQVTAEEVLEHYFLGAEGFLSDSPPPAPSPQRGDGVPELIQECRTLIHQRPTDFATFSREVDWAAKLTILEMVAEETGWDEDILRAYDLEYANLDPDQSLAAPFSPSIPHDKIEEAAAISLDFTRARARGQGIRYPELTNACWRTLSFGEGEFELRPDADFADLDPDFDVESFTQYLKEKK